MMRTRLREKAAALMLQRCFRGMKGRETAEVLQAMLAAKEQVGFLYNEISRLSKDRKRITDERFEIEKVA